MDVAFLFVMVIGFLLLGVPIAMSLGLSSIIFLLVFSESSLASIGQSLFSAFADHYTLLAIPFFILASTFMSTGGVARRVIRFAIAVVGHLKGGLAIAGVFACMLFAALSGSSPATVVAIGSIVIAGMRQVGYSKDFAAGVICNAGTLGILIPPSIVMVVYASAVDVSVGRMFLAGVIPGLLAGLMLMIGIHVVARLRGLPAEPWAGFGEVTIAAFDALWGLLLIVIILGGIYGGVFTPTEAAAIAAVYAFLIATLVYRDMGPLKGRPWLTEGERERTVNTTDLVLLYCVIVAILGGLLVIGGAWVIDHVSAETGGVSGVSLAKVIVYTAAAILVVTAIDAVFQGAMRQGLAAPVGLPVRYRMVAMVIGRNIGLSLWGLVGGLAHPDTRRALLEAGKTTIMLLFIIANALILKHVLTEEQIPQTIAAAMLDAGFGPVMFLVIVNVILLIGGQFMEPSGLIVIVAPLVFPIAISLGIDPIHLGIIMVVNMEIGMITPPVGLNLFVTSGVAGMSMLRVVKAATPWLGIMVIFLIMVTYIPWLSTYLPTTLMGPEVIIR